MGEDQTWTRQLLALMLLSASKAAVEFITNPTSREDATDQLRGAFAEIDYDTLAKAVTRAIDDAADTGKQTLSGAIDTIRDRSVDVVGEAKTRAEKQLGKKKKGRKMRFFLGLVIGGLIAYFLLDEQKRDDMLDKLTGASGPIQQTVQDTASQAQSTANQAVNKAADTVTETAQKATAKAQKEAEQTDAAKPESKATEK